LESQVHPFEDFYYNALFKEHCFTKMQNMKETVLDLWNRLSRTGITDALENFESKKILVLNRLNFVATATALLWFFHSFSFEYGKLRPMMTVANLLPFLLTLSVFIIVKAGYYKKAINTVFIAFPLLLTFIAMFTYRESTLIFHIILCVLPFFFYENVKHIAASFLYTTLLYTITWIYIHFGRLDNTMLFTGLFNYAGLILLFTTLYGIKMQLQAYQKALTKRKDELNKKNEELNGLLQLKDKVFAVISHDVKTPLTSLKLLLNNLNTHLLTKDEMAHFNDMLLSETTKTLDLFDNLLEWSRAELHQGGEEKSNFKPYYLTDATLLLLRSKAKQKNITVENNISRDAVSYASPSAIQVIIRNLLSNAIKFTPENGNIRIESFQNAEAVSISIKDNGMGMDEETVAKVMGTEFYKSRGTLDEEGHGFGIKICNEFIKQNNGTLTCRSKKNKGTEFIIQLPAAKIKNHNLIKVLPAKEAANSFHPNDQYTSVMS
jgi:two-component system, sensor histidine kinase and response regulator